MISVIIPLYNKEHQIANTLHSVLRQTFQNFEIVVVDDGSTDGSVQEVEKVNDNRIRIVRQKNAGVSAARNKGVKEAHYDLVAFLDADDEWKSNYLETQYNLFLKYPQCNVYACGYEFCDSNGIISNTIIRKLAFQGEDGVLTNYFEVASCSHPPICSISVIVKKTAIVNIGGFPIGVKSGEDLLTWARLAIHYKIAYSRKIMAIFHVEGYNVSEKPKRIPAEQDLVGNELSVLWHIHHTPYMKQYISHWHKMRSSIYMRLNMRKNSINEALKGLKYSPLNYKLYIYILLNFLPTNIRPF